MHVWNGQGLRLDGANGVQTASSTGQTGAVTDSV